MQGLNLRPLPCEGACFTLMSYLNPSTPRAGQALRQLQADPEGDPMPKPTDYQALPAWRRETGSMDYYIEAIYLMTSRAEKLRMVILLGGSP